MNHLQIRHLKRFCDKNGLDYQLIDPDLTYSENKDFLESLRPKSLEDLMLESEVQFRRFLKESFLTYYISCQRQGEAVSEESGEPIMVKRFSLKEYANV